jgi:TadE-like protein
MRSRRSGHSVMEFALFLPFLLFLFVGAFDWGFYAWALIATENAARVAALYTSSSAATAGDSLGACPYVLGELADAPNVYSLGSGGSTLSPGGGQGGSGSLGGVGTGGDEGKMHTGIIRGDGDGGGGGGGNIATCAGPPVTVVATAVAGPDASPASLVSVTYQTPVLIPIPGLLTGRISITRMVQMRVKS